MHPAVKIILFLLVLPILVIIFFTVVIPVVIILLILSLFIPSIRLFHVLHTRENPRGGRPQETEASADDSVVDVECTVVDSTGDNPSASEKPPELKP